MDILKNQTYFEKTVKDFINSVQRAQSSFYKEIIHFFECGVYDKYEVLEGLVSNRLNYIKRNNRPYFSSFFSAEQSEIIYLNQLLTILKEKKFSAVIDYINDQSSQLKISPQLCKLLQTFFSIYSYLWSYGNNLLSEDLVKQLGILDLFKAKIDMAVASELKHLQQLNKINSTTLEGGYQLACLIPHYINLINIMARGYSNPAQITKISELLLKNISTTCDIDLDHYFMDGFIYIIPHLSEQDKKKWLELLTPFTEEFLTNPERRGILKQLFNRSFSDGEFNYGIKRLIQINIYLHNPQIIAQSPKHLNGFEGEPLHKCDEWEVAMHQKFLKEHDQQVVEFSKVTLDKKIAMLHLSSKKGFKKPESHYCMHLYDFIIEESRLAHQGDLRYDNGY